MNLGFLSLFAKKTTFTVDLAEIFIASFYRNSHLCHKSRYVGDYRKLPNYSH